MIDEIRPTRAACQQAVAAFVEDCRTNLTVFGADLDWDSNYWASAGVSFGNIDNRSRKLKPELAMRQPFLDFAKAYFRYRQGNAPTLSKWEPLALRALERALCKEDDTCAPDITNATALTFDIALELAKERWANGTYYSTGRHLNSIVDFINERRFVPRPIDWRSSAIKVLCPNDRTGPEAQAHREKKLPSEDVLDALGEIFARNPKHPLDIFTTCTCAILLSIPSGIDQVLNMPYDCERIEKKKDGTKAYGLVMLGRKGAPTEVRWVPDIMVPITQEAIRRLRAITSEARRIAAWHDEHPHEFYRHAECPNVDEDTPLSAAQAAAAIGNGDLPIETARPELWRVGLPSGNGANTLRSLNLWVRSRLPDHFPWSDRSERVKCKDLLFCFQERQLRLDSKPRPMSINLPPQQKLYTDLRTRIEDGGGIWRSIFDRHGYNHGREQPLQVTSHMFRHLLNTMAQRGGMDQDQIARWSGRINPRQNSYYDHMSDLELTDALRALKGKEDAQALSVIAQKVIKMRPPVALEDFNPAFVETAHITEFGFCLHNFVMEPCARFRDCMNCTEHVCVKGDSRLLRLRQLLATVDALCARAEQEIADGVGFADRWYQIQKLTQERLRALVELLESDAVPDGATIRLNNSLEYSRGRRLMQERAGALPAPTFAMPAPRAPGNG